jgi:aminoglycoside phosphotransferase (APT) family kinase protein
MPAPGVLAGYGVEAVRFLGGGHHQNWLCHRRGENVVLRRYVRPPLGDVHYEHVVAGRLADAGWPVPVLLDEPAVVDGSSWALFRWLPGQSRNDADSAEERRDRGRLLAELHETTAGFLDLGQRPGCVESHEVLADSDLDSRVAAYAAWFPNEAHLLAWHLERARRSFSDLRLDEATRVVLHGDFAPWNLLYQSGRLSGIVDLEAAHLNFRVADFALAWRGEADEVVRAYDTCHRLDDIDWALLTPVFWAWLFLGVSRAIAQMSEGVVEPRVLRWTVGNLVKRTPLMGALSTPYPG